MRAFWIAELVRDWEESAGGIAFADSTLRTTFSDPLSVFLGMADAGSFAETGLLPSSPRSCDNRCAKVDRLCQGMTK